MSPSSPAKRGRVLKLAVLAVSIGAVFGIERWSPPTLPPPVARSDVDIPADRFGQLVQQLSEPEGYFDTDNFISNETSYLHVVPTLSAQVAPGGVYFGVGPDQNFTYIVHSKPSLAIIADIRRQNMLEHLLFKVLIEQANTRQEFLCLLFAKECEPDPDAPDLGSLLEEVEAAPHSEPVMAGALRTVRRRLSEDYGLELSRLDYERIEYVYRTFSEQNLDLRFATFGRPSLNYPTFQELLMETDLDGRLQNYLSEESSYQWLRQFQLENRLIPIVGDFAGDRALRAVAAFLNEEGLKISVFYASNVEFYLFGRPSWEHYLANVRAFPFSDDAVFIRSYFPTYGRPHPLNVRGHRSTSLIQPVSGFLEDLAGGRLQTYWDVVSRHNLN